MNFTVTHGTGLGIEVTRLKEKLTRLLSESKDKTFPLNSLAHEVIYQNLDDFSDRSFVKPSSRKNTTAFGSLFFLGGGFKDSLVSDILAMLIFNIVHSFPNLN